MVLGVMDARKVTNRPATDEPGGDRRRAQIVRIVVADDHPIYREGMIRALVDTGRYTVVGEASDGVTAVELIVRERPDVALLDLRMPELGGLGALRRLERAGVTIPVVLLTALTHPEFVTQARSAGAAAFLSKDAARHEIVAVLDTVASGGRVPPASGADTRPRLMAIELELLALLQAGWLVHELPSVANLPRSRVERYLSDAVRKLGAEDCGDAVATAISWGLLRGASPDV